MHFRYWAVISTAIMVASSTGFAANANLEALDNLSFENLGNIITSVSKRPEDSFKSAAAITVITQEDIKLSGATHIAEVLRGVPGLEVARVDSSNWAITSRGFNDTFANKLLVMVDGWTVYTPLFSGVYWDIQDVVLEDIDRIEVIRGPGAALWGANAVNGVINIITKKAEQTQGTYVSQLVGTQDRSITEARYGGTSGDTAYRVYGKFADRMSTETLDHNNGNNHWDSGKAGFRADIDASPTRKVTVQGDFYDAGIHLNDYVPMPVAPFTNVEQDKINSRGGNVLARLTEKHGDGMESTFQAYYDFQSPDYGLLHQDISTFDLDYQTSWAYNDRNQFVWGAGYRLVEDQLDGSPVLSFTPDSRSLALYSAFLQDTYALIPKALDLTLGTKFEHNDYTGFEVQPSAKLAWYPTANQTVWASVARAVRTPSRGDDGILLNAFAVPSQGVIVQQVGNPSFESEELTAYELGYRIRPTAKTSVDVSGFINDYDKLRTAEFLPVQITPQGAFLPVTPGNLGEGQTYGTEVSGTWDVTTRWSLKANYTYMTLDLRNKPDSTDITLAQEKDKIPHHQFNIRSQLYLTDAIDSTTTLYYVDQVPLYNVSDYVRLDTRIGWKVDDGIDLSLVGQNLLESSHQEFGAPLQGVANKIGREFYVKATFRY